MHGFGEHGPHVKDSTKLHYAWLKEKLT